MKIGIKMTLLEKGAVMIAADSGAIIRFRAKGGHFWSYWRKGDETKLSWNWSLYDYEVAPDDKLNTPSLAGTATGIPALIEAEGDDSGERLPAVPGALQEAK